VTAEFVPDAGRLRRLQVAGVASGFAAGAWLGAAEAPAKLAALALPPVGVSLAMVVGVFVARWSVPALLRGTAAVGADVRAAPHLVLWAVLAGGLWAVANTFTIFAIRDIGLSVAFPLWNANSLLGIIWGVVFFGELRGARRSQWLAVVGGAVLMCAGAAALALASTHATATGHPVRGVAAALAAGALWGTMYIPYRKAYLTGMNPLSFVTFFSAGELVTMTLVALGQAGGLAALGRELVVARPVLFWLLCGGFVWVVGDLFQQYAAKYVGISRGIPLSNTNQLWGLLWGVFVFGELRGSGTGSFVEVIAGSLVMAAGAVAIAGATTTPTEHDAWEAAALREQTRYRIDPAYVRAGLLGERTSHQTERRRWLDGVIVTGATAVFVGLGLLAERPALPVAWSALWVLVAATTGLLLGAGYLLWRATGFS
jgi:glucose uptake protein GlcU